MFLAGLVPLADSLSSLPPLLTTPLMDDKELQLVLKGFNLHNQVPYDTTALVHGMFAAYAKASPQSPCIVFEGNVFSYAKVGCLLCLLLLCARRLCTIHHDEAATSSRDHGWGLVGWQPCHAAINAYHCCCGVQVDAAANRIAHYLRNQAGVMPGDIVAVLCLRSPVMVAALLGIFKAGAGYLPLDHHHPEARIEFMLEDAAVKVSPMQLNKTCCTCGCQVLCCSTAQWGAVHASCASYC